MAFSWKLGPIPIRIHAGVFFVAALLGLTQQQGPAGVALWGGTLILAALAHELGHAVTARAFGVTVGVSLPPLVPATHLSPLAPFHRVLVSLAGPTLSIALGLLATRVSSMPALAHLTLAAALHHFGWVNLGWGILNLAPVLPLDGGYAVLAVVDRITPGRGERLVRLFSTALALVLASAALLAHLALPALLCGMIALQNARGLRAYEAERRRDQVEVFARLHLKAAFGAVERDDLSGGVEHCTRAFGMSSDAGLRKDAVRLLAYAYVNQGAWRPLVQLLEAEGTLAMDDAEIEKYERAARELGRLAEAGRIAQLRWPRPHQLA